MPFATTDDVADRLGRALDAGEEQSVTFLLAGATAVIAHAAGKDDDWAAALTPVPGLVRMMTVELVCRALANPNSLRSLSESLGAHSSSAAFRDVGGGLMLTPAEELLMRRTIYGNGTTSVIIPSLADEIDELLWGS